MYVYDFADNICYPMTGYEIVIGSPACTGFVMYASNSNRLWLLAWFQKLLLHRLSEKGASLHNIFYPA